MRNLSSKDNKVRIEQGQHKEYVLPKTYLYSIQKYPNNYFLKYPNLVLKVFSSMVNIIVIAPSWYTSPSFTIIISS